MRLIKRSTPPDHGNYLGSCFVSCGLKPQILGRKYASSLVTGTIAMIKEFLGTRIEHFLIILFCFSSEA